MVDDVLGIPPHTSHQRRTQRVEEEKPHEVETRTGLDNAPIMNRKAIVGRQRDIDPVVIGSESRAPDDVRHGENRSILEEGISVLDTCRSRHSFDACGGKVLSSHPPERDSTRGVEKVVAELPSKRRLHGQPSCHKPHEGRDQVIEMTSGPAGSCPVSGPDSHVW